MSIRTAWALQAFSRHESRDAEHEDELSWRRQPDVREFVSRTTETRSSALVANYPGLLGKSDPLRCAEWVFRATRGAKHPAEQLQGRRCKK